MPKNLNDAIETIGKGKTATLVISESLPVIKDVEVPSNITLQFIDSGCLSIPKGVTVKLGNPPIAGKVKIFDGEGQVKFTLFAPVTINPRWWDARGDNSHDDTDAIQKAIDSVEGNSSHDKKSGIPTSSDVLIKLDRGIYRTTKTLSITKHRTHIRGDGKYATQIRFDPIGSNWVKPVWKEKPGEDPDFSIPRAFLFSTGRLVDPKDKPDVLDTLSQCSLGHLSLLSLNTKDKKIGVSLVDVSMFLLEEVAWFKWTGNKSIGLEIRGRELTTIRAANIQADMPVVIADQPGPRVDCDVFHFYDNNFDALAGDEPCLLIKDGVIITDLTIDGSHHFNGGSGAIYWKSTNPAQTSQNIRIRDLRYEHSKSKRSDAYGIYIDHGGSPKSHTLQGLTLDNVYLPGKIPVLDARGHEIGEIPMNGIYLRNIEQASLRDCRVFCPPEQANIALNADKSVRDLSLWNTYFLEGCTVNLDGLKMVLAIGAAKGRRPLPSTCFFNEEA